MAQFAVTIPLRLDSLANDGRAWYDKCKRKRMQKNLVWLTFVQQKPTITLPCVINLTRIAPRRLDSDNNVSAFKIVRDQIADCIFPGLRAGRADDDERITWQYFQKKGNPKEYAIEIEII